MTRFGWIGRYDINKMSMDDYHEILQHASGRIGPDTGMGGQDLKAIIDTVTDVFETNDETRLFFQSKRPVSNPNIAPNTNVGGEAAK